MLATLFDHGENVSPLLLVERRVRVDGPTARVGVICKRLKLAAFLPSSLPTRPPR